MGKFYIVCALLENALTCLYGLPSLQDYFQQFELFHFVLWPIEAYTY